MTAIELRGVTAGYDGVAAVHDLELFVAPGEVVALLGANGGGKSTIVRTTCGLTTVLAGTVHLLGEDVTGAPPHRRARRGLGGVTADRGLFTQLTVRENLRLGMRRGRRAPELEEWFPVLVNLLDRKAGLLSGGEQQVLALARALAGRPEAIVVDEITIGLGLELAESIMHVLRRAATDWGAGVLVAEQSTELALGIADRACVVRRGRIAIEGSASDLARERDVLEATYLDPD